ncbi:MAG: bifunctional oligoribonuclease/PAP phosphatase NrnA [Planctomycetaceae bacterium]|nr:bifunctional oligoribonuclease/PAP phosphatase NrnA [Planctomycetaceae bacterium]
MTMDWSDLVKTIKAHTQFVITSHIRPDADALGSELALARALKKLGKQVRIVNASPTPTRLQFLDPDKSILILGQGIQEEEALETDVHIIVDTSAWGQLGEVARVFRRTSAKKIIIDHHVSSDEMDAVEFKDVQSEAAGTMIFDLVTALGVKIDMEIAEPLFCAIATDTGWFRFPSTRHKTMDVIASLMDAGVEPYKYYTQLYEQMSLGRMKLAGRALERMKLECEGLLGHTFVKFDDYAETGAEPADTEDLVNECLRIKGTTCALIAIEQPNRQIKVSFRSRPGVNVAAVAEQFQGGGHKQAAGAILPGPLEQAYKSTLQALIETISKSPVTTTG